MDTNKWIFWPRRHKGFLLPRSSVRYSTFDVQRRITSPIFIFRLSSLVLRLGLSGPVGALGGDGVSRAELNVEPYEVSQNMWQIFAYFRV